MKEMKEKRSYLPPQLTVVSFKSERGYATSGPGPFDFFLFWQNNDADQMEDYETGNGWNEGSNHFWD